MTKADSALMEIPTPSDRDKWLKISMAYKAEGGNYETWDEWSKRGGGYNAQGNRDTWRSIKDGGITGATLYGEARANGWEPPQDEYYRPQKTEARRDQQSKAQAIAVTDGQKKKIRDYITDARKHQAEILKYCETRGLAPATVTRFNLGYDAKTCRLVIPYPGAEYYVTRSMTIEPNEKKQRPQREKIFISQ